MTLGQLGDERLDRDGREGRGNDGDRTSRRNHGVHAGHGALMITGAKIGGNHRPQAAFAIGCVIYGCGSFTTAIAPNLCQCCCSAGRSRRSRRGADPASDRRPSSRRTCHGLAACSSTDSLRPPVRSPVAVGPLIGGFCTTYFSWRWVVAGEGGAGSGHPAALPGASRTRRCDERPTCRRSYRRQSSWRSGWELLVFGVALRSSEWDLDGFGRSRTDGWAVVGERLSSALADPRRRCFVILAVLRWEGPPRSAGPKSRSSRRDMLRETMAAVRRADDVASSSTSSRPASSLLSFRCTAIGLPCGLSALATGARHPLPLSVTLLVAAIGIPRCCSPRLASARHGSLHGLLAALQAASFSLRVMLDENAGPARRSSSCR